MRRKENIEDEFLRSLFLAPGCILLGAIAADMLNKIFGDKANLALILILNSVAIISIILNINKKKP